MEPKGEEGAFEPLLQKYLHLAEFTIGLATGSIVLLVGSSILHGRDGRLPWFFASPLLVLAGSVLSGIGFMVVLVVSYEDVQHGNPHTAASYALIETLGFKSLLLFVVWVCLADHFGNALRLRSRVVSLAGAQDYRRILLPRVPLALQTLGQEHL